MRRQPSKTQYAQARPVWLLTIEWAGRVFRFATEPVTVTTAAGESLYFEGEIGDVDLEEGVNVFSTAVEDLSVPLEVIFPINVVERIRAGTPLSAAHGELAMVLVTERSGAVQQTWERRFALIEGYLDRPIYGHPQRPVGWARFSLESRPFDDRTTVLPSTARFNQRTFDTTLLYEETVGKTYPLVFGVGAGWDGSLTYKATPAYRLTWQALIRELFISYEHVVADSVTVFDNSGGSDTFAVQYGVDAIGQPYSYVDVFGGSISTGDTEYWVAWHNGTAPVGGVRAIESDGPISGAGDLLLWVFARGSLSVDVQEWVSVRGLLNRYKFAGYIQDPDATLWRWARDKVLSLLPLALVTRPSGVVPLVFEADTLRVEADIEVGRDWLRLSPFTPMWSRRDVVNQVTLEHQNQPPTGGYRSSARVGPEYSAGSRMEIGVTPSQHAAESRAQWGETREEIIASEFIVDDATAVLIAEDRIRRRGFQVDEAVFEASPRWGALQVGSRVRITDADGGMERQIGAITRRTWLAGSWRFTVEFSRDPLLDQSGSR